MLFIEFDSLKLYYFIFNSEKWFGLILSYILKDYQISNYVIHLTLRSTLKMHSFGDVYAILKNILFSRLFLSLYLRLYLSFNVK